MHNTASTDKDMNTALNTKFLLRTAIRGLTLATVAVIAGAAAVFAAYHYAKPGLPDAATVRDIPLQVPLRVYTRDGKLIQEIGEQRRILVNSFDEFPEHVVQAFLAAEDDRFFTHPGIDYQGVLRAAIKNTLAGSRKQGASTLTQQLARDYFLTRERSYIRKIKEAFLAWKIEQEFSKQEIMTLFLNKMFFGQRAYGVAAAGQVYFGKELGDLNVAEAATLAGVLQAPSAYNPVSGPDQARDRRRYVLGRMRDLGFINQQQWQGATDYPLQSKLHGADIELSAPYLAEMVRLELVNKYGRDITTRGYRVTTTIDSRMQQAANFAVRDGLLEYDRRHGFRGALASIDVATATDAQIEQTLADYSGAGGLKSAIVMAINENNSADLRLAGDLRVRLPWSGVNWAVPFIDRRRVGNKPESIDEVLTAGDVVYVIETVTGSYALAQLPEAQGALVALDPNDGAIAALTGGFDYYTSKFNRVIQAERQPGSSFKPFIYSAALANGFTLASVINDAPFVVSSRDYEGEWRPKNSTGKFYGPTRMRNGLVRSLNLVSVRMLDKIGIRSALEHIRKFGFGDKALPADLSLALGSGGATPLDMASGYAVLANGGFQVTPYFIDRVELADGEVLEIANPARVCKRCEAVEQPEPDNIEALNVTSAATLYGEALREFLGDAVIAPRVLPATNIWLVQDIMRDVIRRGTGRRARVLNRNDLAGKTGTSNDQRDAWFAGFNPDLVAVTWVGFDSDEPLGAGEEGGRTALPVWIHFMRDALAGAPQRSYPQPSGLVTVRVSSKTGDLAGANDRDFVFETFEAGTEPTVTGDDILASPFGDSGEAVELENVF
ncbi:MAG: penicillin-binding protein 1A [Pseudomonadota bacterium]